MNSSQNNLKNFAPVQEQKKKRQLQLSRLKPSYFNRDPQIAMCDEGSRK